MKQHFLSLDFQDANPISVDDIYQMATNKNTANDYRSYLQYVLSSARRALNQTKADLQSIRFRIQDNGCIIPFGEGGHPYCKNFHAEIPGLELSTLTMNLCYS